MDPREYDLMYRVEDEHWWYRGMEAITRKLLGRWFRDSVPLKILDAGCGTGAAMSNFLTDYGLVTGVDIEPLALAYCQKRDLTRLTCASVLDLPFASATFDLVASFDVLYERAVADDLAALREFARILAPGGRVLLRLPAYDWLRGTHDKVVHTRKRYTIKEVAYLLVQSGFTLEHISFANMFLFPLAVIKRLSERLIPPSEEHSDLTLNAGPFNRVLQKILASEAPLVAGSGLPFGLSVVAVGRR